MMSEVDSSVAPDGPLRNGAERVSFVTTKRDQIWAACYEKEFGEEYRPSPDFVLLSQTHWDIRCVCRSA
jgi:hypothetical protein